MKLAALICCAILSVAVGGLWLQSWGSGWSKVVTGSKYVYQVESRRGAVALVSFSSTEEDEYYSERKIPYWGIAIVPVAGCVLLGWRLARRRKSSTRGFPVS